ncbi:MAG: winged helix-turn-helix transcriptional regulator [Bacteroidales bacterium]|nr:winged helix-turn-helix transcriptional regulator [Bacteroidales bacterium]
MSDEKNLYCKCLYYSANALARIITRIAEEEFAAVNLAPSYAFMVMTINKRPGLLAGELSDIMMLTPSTVTRLLEKLESQQLVKRHMEGRVTMIYPTPKSVEINQEIQAAWLKLYKRYTDILGEEFAHQMTEDIFISAVKLDTK